MSKKKTTSHNKIAPSLQFVVLCDAVSMPDQRGKVSFIGVFDKFLKTGRIAHFIIAVGWKNGLGENQFRIRLLDPDLKVKLETPEIKFVLSHESEGARVDLNVDGMDFPTPGVYWIEIVLNGETEQSIPLPVDSEQA